MGDDVLPLPNNMVERTGPGRPAAHHDRWAASSGCYFRSIVKGGADAIGLTVGASNNPRLADRATSAAEWPSIVIGVQWPAR